VFIYRFANFTDFSQNCIRFFFKIDKAVYGVKESSKAIELLTKLNDTSVKLSEIHKTLKDNVSNFEEETNAVLAEISKVRESVNKHLGKIEDKRHVLYQILWCK
jgi:hypothetical protein